MTEGIEEEEEEEEEEESKIYPDSPAISIPKFASDFSDHYESSSQHQWNDMDEKGDAVFYTMHMEKSIIDQDFMAGKILVLLLLLLFIAFMNRNSYV